MLWNPLAGTLYIVNKIIAFPVPSQDVPNQTLPGIIKLFPARDNFVNDILAGDRKNYNLFYSVGYQNCLLCFYELYVQYSIWCV
jgi:hypothetical protein